MAKHRFDKRDGTKWGGPELVTELDDRQSTTHSTGNDDSMSPAARNAGPHGTAGERPRQ